MSLLPYDINKHVKTILQNESNTNASGVGVQGYWPNNSLQFVPLNSPEPCDPSGKPLGLVYVRYFWMPNIRSMNTYFLRRDRMRYYVMGRDYDQMWRTAERMVEILNPQIVNQKKVGSTPLTSPSNEIFHTWIIGSNSMAPMEIGGLAATMLEFEIRYKQHTNLNGTDYSVTPDGY